MVPGKHQLPKSSAKNESGQYERFENFMRRLLQVPHSEIKEKLDAEKRTQTKRASASRASRAKG